HFPRGTLGIGIFDAEHERAAVAAGGQPVEERRSGGADMEITSRGRGKPNANHPTILACRLRSEDLAERRPEDLARFHQHRAPAKGLEVETARGLEVLLEVGAHARREV